MKSKGGQQARQSPVKLKLSNIRTDAGTQCRARIDEATVAEYAEEMVNGSRFPPVVVFRSEGKPILADGFHRLHAARQAKFENILAEVRPGTRTDALKFSLGSNQSHGLRRSSEDKHHAVDLALREFTQWSDRMIAGLCGVSPPFVGAVRRELKSVYSCAKRTGRDGKARKMPTRPVNGTPAQSDPVQIPTKRDAEAHRILKEIGTYLGGVRERIQEVARRYPDKRPVIQGFISKARSDLAFLSREIGDY